jgi:Na+-driven multidrug efflux pump
MIGHPLHTTPAPPRGAMSVVSASRLVASRGSARTCAPGRRSALGGTDAPWSSSRRVARRRVRATRRARREPLSVALARDARRFGRGVGIRRDVSVTVSRHDGCDEPEAGGRAPPSGTSEGVDADDVDASSSSSTPNTDEPSSNLDARIWALALPAVASLLLDPLLGAVDTAFVGRIEGEGAAAALGGLAVSSTVFNFSFKLFNFLAVVTGPLVASQIAAAKEADANGASCDERRDASNTVRGAMTLALALGVAAFATLELAADPILAWAGGDAAKGDLAVSLSTSPSPTAVGAVGVGVQTFNMRSGGAPETLIGEAEAYLRVRALSAPAALAGTVAVGAYRGLLDTRTPLLVSAGAQAVNLALDPILIFGWGPIPAFGVAGAAAATTAAEWGSAVAFWILLAKEELLPANGPAGLLKKDVKEEEERSDGQEGTLLDSPFSSLASWANRLGPLASGSFSQLARTLLLQAVLVRATAEAAGAGAAGAHQICIQVWWVTLFALDALAVAAQSLVAESLGRGDVLYARTAADRALVWALAAGAAVGIGIHAAGPLLPALFTDDAGVAALAEAPLDLVAALQPLNAAVFVGDGVLQGAADFDYLAAAMAVSAAPALSMLSGVGEGQEAAAGLGVVWRAMAALQIGRAATLAMRYWSEDGPVSVKIELGGGSEATKKTPPE